MSSRRSTPVSAKKASKPKRLPTTSFLLEIGSEECRADDSAGYGATRRIDGRVVANQRLSHDQIQVFGTPRRLAVLVRGWPTGKRRPCRKRWVLPKPSRLMTRANRPKPPKGLRNHRAWTSANWRPGKRPKACTLRGQTGERVARGNGLDRTLPNLLQRLTFPKTMKWNVSGSGIHGLFVGWSRSWRAGPVL